MGLSQSKLKYLVRMDSERRNYAIGIVLLLIVVCEWTGSSFLTQSLFDEGYEKPFLVTYLNTSAFAIYLLPFLLRYWRQRRGQDGEVLAPEARGLYDPLPPDLSGELPPQAPPTDLPPLTTRETAQLASVFCFFWFIANYSVNASLDYTSVASSTILASMSGFFTLGIARMFGVETFTLAKLGAVLTSFLGVLLVSLADSYKDDPNAPIPSNTIASGHGTIPMNPSPYKRGSNFARSSSLASVSLSDSASHPSVTNPILGDLLALLSALFYALYVTLLKIRIKTESRVNMQLFFGFVGVFNMVTLWPLGIILHYTGVETFEWPKGGQIWAVLLINMFITLSSDYLYLISMLKTTPLVVTVGLSLTIPLAVFGDWTLLSINPSWQTMIGAILVLGSFVALGLEGDQEVVSSTTEPVDRSVYESLPGRVSVSSEMAEDSGERGRSTTRTKSLGHSSVSIPADGTRSRQATSHSPNPAEDRDRPSLDESSTRGVEGD